MREMRRHRRQSLSAAGLVLALGLAGCGGAGRSIAHLGKTKIKVTVTKPAAAATSRTDQALEAATIKFAGCMRSHGVPNFPDPAAPGGTSSTKVAFDPNSPTFKTAAEACKSLLTSIASALPAISPAIQSDLLKAVACMRTHGVPNMPDPTFTNGVPRFTGITKVVNVRSQAFESAFQTCKSLVPAGVIP
jgi:hypothetical protein